jgi:uncharacterized protein GlcG (DUF336 family)
MRLHPRSVTIITGRAGRPTFYAVAVFVHRPFPPEIIPMRLVTSSLALGLTLLSVPASAQLIDHKDLSYAMALDIATGTLEACKARTYPVSVVVVDRGGNVVVSLKADGAGPHTTENARRKAYTALTFKMTTKAFIEEMKTRQVRREQTTLPGVIAIDGGVPIKAGKDVIGGVGASGSPGVDEECVSAGLDKVKQHLQ